jgi:hypothetical protein
MHGVSCRPARYPQQCVTTTSFYHSITPALMCRLHRLHFPSLTGLISETFSVPLSSTCKDMRHQAMITQITLSRPYHCYPVTKKPYTFPVLISVLWPYVRQSTIPRSSSQIASYPSSSSKPGQRHQGGQVQESRSTYCCGLRQKSTTGSYGTDSALSVARVSS